MKVYVVAQGEYSDYHIVAIFSDRHQAELKCATLNDDCKEVSEWDVDAETLQGEIVKSYNIVYSTNTGKITHISDPQYVIKGSVSTNQEFCFGGNHLPSTYTFEVEADTEDQARKIFQDKYMEAKYKYLLGELSNLEKEMNKGG